MNQKALSLQGRMRVNNPSLIQLYSAATPNGLKVAVALEELCDLRATKDGFDYEPHTVNLRTGETHHKPFTTMFAGEKIPGIYDPHGPGGSAVSLFESGAILMYLAEKYSVLLQSHDTKARCETIQWLFFGSSSVSTQFKLFGFYYKYCPHKLSCQCSWMR